MRYEGKIFRPPPEADSFLLQCTVGCSHNKCTFCGMYKDRKFRIRSVEEIIGDIKMAKVSMGRRLLKVFLCDGDAISMNTKDLLRILSELKKAFPFLQKVSTYAGPQSTLNKSAEELKLLKEAGLNKVYLGVETGDDELLKVVQKGASSLEIIEAGKNIVGSGINLTTMVMLGLGGQDSGKHIMATSELINEIQPQNVGILTTVPVENTSLYRKVKNGEFQLLDAYEILEEMKLLIGNIKVENILVDATHKSNVLSLLGSLPKDRGRLIKEVEYELQNKNPELTGKAYIGDF
ncbi:radical SAM protein [Marinifilum flexuosum]|uniref:Radical SAM family protein n=1 Tax=Marinifilum flexuosum TaxID=1117708 RepID=A0A419WF06_9BACT|nr:radical SAM protein [Marinifilum flexuosum]RKD94070.1 radical SAM family protein [Marinifilum flexuosum]